MAVPFKYSRVSGCADASLERGTGHPIVELGPIRDLDKARALQQPMMRQVRTWDKALAQVSRKRLRKSAHRDGTELLAVIKQQGAMRDRAKAVRLFQDRLEYRREIAGR